MASIASVPGMTVEPTTLVRRGLITVLTLALVAALAWAGTALLAPPPWQLTLLTRGVAPGVGPGTVVQMNGVTIGAVTDVRARRSGRLGLVMDIDRDWSGRLTDGLTVDFAPHNLFGIGSVQLTPAAGGAALADGAEYLPPRAPEDSTMSGLLRALADIESTALRPHMSELLRQSDTVTKGMLPLIGALGQLAQADAETKTVPTSQSLPQLAATLAAVAPMVDDVLAGVRTLWEWTGPETPGYPAAQTATIAALRDVTGPDLAGLLARLRPLEPVLTPVVDLMSRTVDSFPEATANGRQVSDLIETLRRAIHDTPDGKVLDVAVQVRAIPPGAAAAGPTAATETAAATAPTTGGHR